MLIIDEIANSKEVLKLNCISEHYNPEEIIMFDIETTGLSPRNSIIYLIGMNYYEDGNWKISLLFNDDGQSEVELIKTFMEKLKNYKYLIHFNGDTFDIKFVTTRLELINLKLKLGINNNFPLVKSIDLYKLFKPFKKPLGLPNARQKTIEEYLGINRVDEYNGGELINVYFDYLASGNEKLKTLLIQHNRDDMEGMFFLSSIFSIRALFEGKIKVHDFSVKKKDDSLYFIINVDLEHSLTTDISIIKNGVLINTFTDTATIRIPIEQGEFKYFISETGDYYYIPELDYIIRKDFKADYSDYELQKPKKCNCFIPAEGYFLKTFDQVGCLKCFRKDYSDKQSYIMLSDDFLSDIEFVSCYVKNVLRSMQYK